jgi:hypothetical protein
MNAPTAASIVRPDEVDRLIEQPEMEEAEPAAA